MCERCDNIKKFTIQDYTTFDNSNAWIVIEENIFLFYIRHGNYVLKHPIKFCPFCGKELILNTEPTTPDECTTIFQYLRLLDTFTERKGPEYEKWRYASDYVMKHYNDKSCQEMIKHIEKKFKKNEGTEF